MCIDGIKSFKKFTKSFSYLSDCCSHHWSQKVVECLPQVSSDARVFFVVADGASLGEYKKQTVSIENGGFLKRILKSRGAPVGSAFHQVIMQKACREKDEGKGTDDNTFLNLSMHTKKMQFYRCKNCSLPKKSLNLPSKIVPHMHIRTHVHHTHANACTCTHAHVNMHSNAHASLHVDTRESMHAHTCACARTHPQMYITCIFSWHLSCFTTGSAIFIRYLLTLYIWRGY